MSTETIGVQRDEIGDVESVADAKQQYVNGELTEYELERLVEGALAVEQTETEAADSDETDVDVIAELDTDAVVQTLLWAAGGFVFGTAFAIVSVFYATTVGVPFAVFMVTFLAATSYGAAKAFDTGVWALFDVITALIVAGLVMAVLAPMMVDVINEVENV